MQRRGVVSLQDRATRLEADCEVLRKHIAAAESLQLEQQLNIESLLAQAVPKATVEQLMERIHSELLAMVHKLEEDLSLKYDDEIAADAEWRANFEMHAIGVEKQMGTQKDTLTAFEMTLQEMRERVQTWMDKPTPSTNISETTTPVDSSDDLRPGVRFCLPTPGGTTERKRPQVLHLLSTSPHLPLRILTPN